MGRLFDLESPLFVFLGKLADLLILNILTLICCSPVFTIGASLTAMNYVALKMVRNEETYIVKSFFKSFRQNFRQATLIWLIYLLVFVILIGDFFIFKYSTLEFPGWVRIAFLSVVLIVLFASMHVFPVLARFDNSIKNTFRNSLFMSILAFPKTILMIVCWIIPVLVAAFFVRAMPVVFALGISGPGFLCALLYNKTFKRFEPEEEVVSDEEWTLEPLEGEETAENIMDDGDKVNTAEGREIKETGEEPTEETEKTI